MGRKRRPRRTRTAHSNEPGVVASPFTRVGREQSAAVPRVLTRRRVRVGAERKIVGEGKNKNKTKRG